MSQSNAIEVLKKEINEYECALALDDVNFAKVTNKDKKLILELINSHKKALLALEINESLINDLLLLANMRADDTITGNEIISCLLKNKVNIVQGKDFIWERVGEQK